MIVNRPADVAHKIQLLRLLTAIVDDPLLASSLFFKGGTCAAMSGWLNRFSVDLDFDILKDASKRLIRSHLESRFSDLSLHIDTKSTDVIMYAVKYSAPKGTRNTIHIDCMPQEAKSTTYESRKLPEIDRVVTCQTQESMVAHKLVTPLDRYKKHKTIAGRDVYDIHEFLLHGFLYTPAIIVERTGRKPRVVFTQLIQLLGRHVTDQLLQEDLNTVLPYNEFRKIRKTLKQETLSLLRTELSRLT